MQWQSGAQPIATVAFGLAWILPRHEDVNTDDRRTKMIEQQITARGIDEPALLAAFGQVPREAFIPAHLAEFAYVDSALPLEQRQTISQPYVVALMLSALQLRPGDRVLEVGTGWGYAAAVASRLVAEVYTVERLEALADRARTNLAAGGFDNVRVRHGDGTRGWPEHAPYDAIVVAAGGPFVPPALLDQLTPGGRIVLPVGEDADVQSLVRLTRRGNRFVREDLGDVRFVPLVGEQGCR